MAIPWSAPSYSSQRHEAGGQRDVRQVQREKLNRASRLLLGAMIEAYDVLSQLQAEVGCDVQDNRNIASLREFVNIQHGQSQNQEPAENITPHQPEKSESSEGNIELSVTCQTPADCQLKASPVAAAESPDTEEDREHIDNTGDTPCPELSLPDIVPVVSNQLQTPDIILTSKKTPKISCRGRKTRPKFRLTNLNELHRTKKSSTPSQMTWKDVGSKLGEVSKKWQKPCGHAGRRRSVADVPRNNQDQDSPPCSSSDQPDWSLFPVHPPPPPPPPSDDLSSGLLINNVLKVVQVFGLYLIVKKFENLLK